jgi:hypothetical protein
LACAGAAGRLAAQTQAASPSPQASGGADQAKNTAQSASPNDGINVVIRFYDKRVYYPESEIPVKVTISNTTAATFRFKLAEDRVYSITFDARTQSNRGLDASDTYKKALAETRPVFYREVALNPGEEYSFVEDLGRYVALPGAGTFTLRASFWPELVQAAPGATWVQLPPIASNALILAVRPSLGLPPASDLVSPETGEILKPEALPPDEVVERTIVARQRSRWNEFFLYLDVEALLTRNEGKKRAYDRESDDGRRKMLEKYKADLQSNIVDQDIVTVPSSFEILETKYASSTGVVRVLEKFDYRSFKMVKEYEYDLVRRDNIWFIEGYSVLNKGTE